MERRSSSKQHCIRSILSLAWPHPAEFPSYRFKAGFAVTNVLVIILSGTFWFRSRLFPGPMYRQPSEHEPCVGAETSCSCSYGNGQPSWIEVRATCSTIHGSSLCARRGAGRLSNYMKHPGDSIWVICILDMSSFSCCLLLYMCVILHKPWLCLDALSPSRLDSSWEPCENSEPCKSLMAGKYTFPVCLCA